MAALGALKPDARGMRVLVEDLAELDRRVAIAMLAIGQHHRQPEARLAAQLQVAMLGERAIGGLGDREVATIARTVGKGEHLGGAERTREPRGGRGRGRGAIALRRLRECRAGPTKKNCAILHKTNSSHGPPHRKPQQQCATRAKLFAEASASLTPSARSFAARGEAA